MAAAQNLLTTPYSRCFNSPYICRHHLVNLFPGFSIFTRHDNNNRLIKIVGHSASRPLFEFCNKKTRWRIRTINTGKDFDGILESEEINRVNVDALLSMAEVLCIAPSAILAIGSAIISVLSNLQTGLLIVPAWPLGAYMNRFLVLQIVLLGGAVTIGAVIRERQWRRINRDSVKLGSSGVNLIERIEKVEEDIRSSATIIRVLSRQLEKLGIRFRVTRKALKGPITETAALAQKNSEATRALAVQEDILEKELGEIQKVLLAMQEQQQKQVELILAIVKAGKLKESRREPLAEEQTMGLNRSVPEGRKEVKRIETEAWPQKESNNDRVST